MSETLLEVKNLCVEYRTFDGVVKAKQSDYHIKFSMQF